MLTKHPDSMPVLTQHTCRLNSISSLRASLNTGPSLSASTNQGVLAASGGGMGGAASPSSGTAGRMPLASSLKKSSKENEPCHQILDSQRPIGGNECSDIRKKSVLVAVLVTDAFLRIEF